MTCGKVGTATLLALLLVRCSSSSKSAVDAEPVDAAVDSAAIDVQDVDGPGIDTVPDVQPDRQAADQQPDQLVDAGVDASIGCVASQPAVITQSSNIHSVSIRVDSKDDAHVSYYAVGSMEAVLAHATNESGAWKSELVVGNEGAQSALTIDAADKVYIGYLTNGFGRELHVTTNASGNWVDTLVESSIGTFGGKLSLGVDGNDHLHLFFYDDEDYRLRYTSNASGSWKTTTLDSANVDSTQTSLKIDSNGALHLSYGSVTNGVRYATNASGTWSIVDIGSKANQGATSLGVDSNGKIHIAYEGWDLHLKYATNSGPGGVWQTTVVDSSGYFRNVALTVDSSDRVHIGYRDNNYDLKLATNAAGAWQTMILEAAGVVGKRIAVDSDSMDRIHLIHADETKAQLKYLVVTCQ